MKWEASQIYLKPIPFNRSSIKLTSFKDEDLDRLLREMPCFHLLHLSLSLHLNVYIFSNLPSLLVIVPIVSSSLYKDVLFLFVQLCIFRQET